TKLIFPILTLAWIFVIFSFSLQNGSISSLQSGVITKYIHSLLSNINMNLELKLLSLIIRKLAHFTEFFILGCLVRKSSIDLKRNDLLLFIFLIPILDEFIQSFIPDRAMSVIDMGIDSLGIIFGLVCISLLDYLISRK
ncbi:MAG TPA: VanZ family protein, partial [Erysipelotrichaceae bacterium]|nr:VanZ family protein [Erysipelotrichaceae bacterium]